MAEISVSVVLPVYNGEHFIKQAIDSILAQSFSDFELIVVNDGSTDGTQAVLDTYTDTRLRVLEQSNQGLVASLNTAILQARTEFIARHDADDSSKPDRLARQYEYMVAHPETVLLGSSMGVMDTSGKYLHEHYVLLNDPELKEELLTRSPFAHGSVMYRRDVFKKAGGYQQSEWPAEDYGLWLRMAPHGNFVNLDQPLYVYRENATGISLTNQAMQQQKAKMIQRKAWKRRRYLLKNRIRAGSYIGLTMDQFRIERITNNLLVALKTSLLNLRLPTSLRIIYLIMSDARIARKCARLLVMKLGLKHG